VCKLFSFQFQAHSLRISPEIFFEISSNRTMCNVQEHNSCINIPSSQTFRYY
jgi:hypothetical protein